MRAHVVMIFAAFAFVVRAASVVHAADTSGVPADSSAVAWLVSAAVEANMSTDHAVAESLATRALDALGGAERADPIQLGSAHLALSRSLLARSQFTDGRALASAMRALELVGENTPADDVRRAEGEYLVAWALALSGRTDEEVFRYARASIDKYRRILGDDTEPVAAVSRLIGLNFERLGEADSARVWYGRAIAIRERLDLPRDKAIASIHLELSRLEARFGNLDRAREEVEAARRETESRLGPSDPAMSQVYRRYGSIEWSAGDFSRAADYNQMALRIALDNPKPDPLEVAGLRASAAWPLYSLGDVLRARDLLQAAIPVMEKELGPAHPQTSFYRTAFVLALGAAGDTSAALAQCRTLRATFERDTPSRDPTALASTLVSEAALLGADHPDSALILLDRAVQTATGHAGSVPILAQSRAQQLICNSDLQRWDEVDRHAVELRSLLADPAVRGTENEVWALEQWAFVEGRRGRMNEAIRLALSASRTSRRVLLRGLRSLPDREGLRFSWNRAKPLYQLLGLVQGSDPDSARVGWDELVRWRGLVAAEIAGRRPPRGQGVPAEAIEAHAAWARAQSRLAQAEVRLASTGSASDAEFGLDSLRAEVTAAERRWALLAPRDAALATQDVGIDQVRAALGPDEALVSFSMIVRRGEPERIIAFAARGSAPYEPARTIDLGPVEDLAEAIESWRKTASRSPRGDAASEKRCREAGSRLRAISWDVIAPVVRGAKDVFLVPEGPLHDLPWGALPDGDRGYLVERAPTLHVIDAERALTTRRPRFDQGGILAMGAVDFDRAEARESLPTSATERSNVAQLHAVATRAVATGCRDSAVGNFASLPGTEAEVRAISRIQIDAHLLTGARATEEAFKSLAPECAVIHLATHGIVLADTCEHEMPGTRGVGGVAPVEQERSKSKSLPSPWLGRRTFLAMAGANRASEHVADENEGWLTAEEVSTLDLRAADWVVLSACRSGIADIWRTEGLLGMRRAFRLAGARSVIASGWDVDDDATREWMTALYEARAHGAPTAAAASQEACRRTLNARRTSGRSTHPFYWAAFTATGE